MAKRVMHKPKMGGKGAKPVFKLRKAKPEPDDRPQPFAKKQKRKGGLEGMKI